MRYFANEYGPPLPSGWTLSQPRTAPGSAKPGVRLLKTTKSRDVDHLSVLALQLERNRFHASAQFAVETLNRWPDRRDPHLVKQFTVERVCCGERNLGDFRGTEPHTKLGLSRAHSFLT